MGYHIISFVAREVGKRNVLLFGILLFIVLIFMFLTTLTFCMTGRLLLLILIILDIVITRRIPIFMGYRIVNGIVIRKLFISGIGIRISGLLFIIS
jgi:hypothetical protein